MTAHAQQALDNLTAHGTASSAPIRAALGVSQPTMSRILPEPCLLDRMRVVNSPSFWCVVTTALPIW